MTIVGDGADRSLSSLTAMARTLLYLVRHGEQDHVTGGEDAGLSPLGVKQAHRLGRQLAEVPFVQTRLAGNWSTDTPGPIADWWQEVANLRNRVVHGAYTQ